MRKIIITEVHGEQLLLVSQDCCNKSPQTEWLKTVEIYFLTVQDTRGLKKKKKNQGVSKIGFL